MKRSTKRRLAAVLAACVVLAIPPALHIKDSLDKTPDPRGTLKAALYLTFTPAHITPIGSRPRLLLVEVAAMTSFRRGDALETYLEARGWTPTDRFGSHRLFRRKGQLLNVYLRPFTGRFRLCELDRQP